MIEAAVALASLGYAVFPTAPDKSPLTSRGHLDGTTDVARIRSWAWDGGIGLVIPDGTIVVDVDPRNGGLDTMAALADLHGPLPLTRTVRTAGGGSHYYFALPSELGLRGSLGPGVDVKKPGRGYVLVPPTAGYAYVRGGRPTPCPDWLLDEIRVDPVEVTPGCYFAFAGGTPYALKTLENAAERIRTRGEGGRRAQINAESFVLGTLCASGQIDEDRALDTILGAALDAGLTEREALKAMKYGWEAGLRRGR